CDNTAYVADELQKAGFELVIPPQFNQFMVKCESDSETEHLLEAVQKSGVCWCGSSMWEGKKVIRISVCSHATTHEDVDKSVRTFKAARR
ncbi:MAG: aspartate aminotransferase family protein, partial [Firmicutes bacterium]|nr:aspartate aminotransferase family protein [Bacillota bacterium]